MVQSLHSKRVACLFFFLMISTGLFVNAQNKPAKYDYEISFYTFKFYASLMHDSSHMNDPFANYLTILDNTYDKFKLPYPLTTKFDSVEFVVKDVKGRKLKVMSSELAIIFKDGGANFAQSEGGKLIKTATDLLNNSKPGDQIVFRNIELFDGATNKNLTLTNFAIHY